MDDFVTSIATDQASGLVSLVLSRAIGEIQLTSNFSNDLQNLRSELERLEAIMCGAGTTAAAAGNSLIRSWLREVKNIAYQADDLLDDYAYGSWMIKDQKTTRISFLGFSYRNPIIFRLGMAHRVNDLRICIDAAYNVATNKLGISPVILTGQRSDKPARSTTMTSDTARREFARENADENYLIGRTDGESFIVNTICNNMVAGGLQLFAVLGNAGYGKTALLKSVSRHARVEACFKERVWICVSYHFNPEEILVKIARKLLGECKDTDPRDVILNKLARKLRYQRCLVILDDVWDTMTDSVWDIISVWLKRIIRHARQNLTILVTTRIKEVAEVMKRGTVKHRVHDLQPLTPGASWELFVTRLTIGCGTSEGIAREMVKRCQGVPLAIKALADTLSKNKDEKWHEIEESEIWVLNATEGLIPSLRISLDYLPNVAVKRCFEYCAIFEKGARIEKKKLIQLWIAQGLIQPSREQLMKPKKLEHIGMEYFDKLLNYYLFLEEEQDEYGTVEYCKMHNAVLELAQHVSRDEWLTMTKDTTCTNSETRHLRLANYEPNTEPNKKVRTMVVVVDRMNDRRINGVLRHVKYLRVLCLVKIGLIDLPSAVSELNHLRYLDISHNIFFRLPEAITNIWHLQTLRCEVVVRKTRMEISRDFEWSKLRNIRHIAMEVVLYVPRAMNQLKCLQTVPPLNLAESPGNISDLGPLSEIEGRLELHGLESVRTEREAIEAHLDGKPYICELHLRWSKERTTNGNNNNNDKIIFGALRPHEHLKALMVSGFMGKELPSWLELLSFSLVTLELTYCYHVQTLCPTLESLRRLKVARCSRLTQMNVDRFPSLLYLTIEWCPELSQISSNGFENCKKLQVLYIDGCDSLSAIPSLEPLHKLSTLEIVSCSGVLSEIVGIKDLPSLKKLRLGPFCKNLDRFPVEETSNDQHIPRCSASLETLDLYGWEGLGPSFPNMFQHCSALTHLSIQRFSALNQLPEWLGMLTSLRQLTLWDLHSLEYLPPYYDVTPQPPHVKLIVNGCPLLPPINKATYK